MTEAPAAASRNTTIGERVRFYRTARDVTLEQLAAKVNLSFQQLSKYETGESRWPADLVCDIARVLKVDVRQLLGTGTAKTEPSRQEWEAERMRSALLKLPDHTRRIGYQIITLIANL